MNLTKLSVYNPQIVVIVLAVLMFYGAVSALKLPVQLIPDIDEPTISISTKWQGASPEEIESEIIEPQEYVIKNTPGLKKLSSSITQGQGTITMLFSKSTNMEQSIISVINSLNQAANNPVDADEPVINWRDHKYVASLFVVPVGENNTKDVNQLQHVIDEVVKPAFADIAGINWVNLNSWRPKELNIIFDPYILASLNLSIEHIKNAVNSSRNLSGGLAEVGRRQYVLRYAGQFGIANIEKLVVAYDNDRPVYLGDVATVEENLADRDGFILRNGLPSYYMTLTREEGADTVAILDEINKKIEALNLGPLLQYKMAVELSYDASIHIRDALDLVKGSLFTGLLLVIAMLWIFLNSVRATIIIVFSIPVSVAIVFLVFSWLGRSLNVISLAGIAFAIGVVLDASIMVQENIARLRSLGLTKILSITKGTYEVRGALLASTITSVAIFTPFFFVEGIEGQLFFDLTLALTLAVSASYFVAISIVPFLNQSTFDVTPRTDNMECYWTWFTRIVLKATNTGNKRIAWLLCLLGGSLVTPFAFKPDISFLPRVPTDSFYVDFNLAPGSNLDTLEKNLANTVKERLQPYLNGDKQPKVKDYNFYVNSTGDNGLFIYANDRIDVEWLMDVVKKDVLDGLPGTESVAVYRSSMINVSGESRARSIELLLQGEDLEKLMNAAKAGLELAKQTWPGGTATVSPGVELATPELEVVPNWERIAEVGLTPSMIGERFQAYTDGLYINEFFNGDERINVKLRALPWSNPDQLAYMPVYTPLGGIQPIGGLAEIKRGVGPGELRRVDGNRSLVLTLYLSEADSFKSVLSDVNGVLIPAIKKSLPEHYRVLIAGNVERYNSAMEEMSVNYAFALLLLLLLMNAIFKSIKDSLIVAALIPLSMAGGLIFLSILNVFTKQPMDTITMIGFIIVSGLVVNNGILLIQQYRLAQNDAFTNTDAVSYAVRTRIRPIYLSTLSSILGMCPLLLFPGVGSEIYRGLATVIVGGMCFSLLFTAILIPCFLRYGERPENTFDVSQSSGLAIDVQKHSAEVVENG